MPAPDYALAMRRPAMTSAAPAVSRVTTRRASNAVLLSAFGVLVAMYFVVAALTTGRTLFVPELALDRAVPLQPAWTPVYVSMWVFSLLPVFVVRDTGMRRRAILSYLTTVVTAYVVFLFYPTAAPRPAVVPGEGVVAWSLRTLYALDPPYNCFPSLHVAYAFLAALWTHHVRRRIGLAALAWAALIGVSTLFIKQHYAADIFAGALLALAAYAICRHGLPDRAADAS
jgi:membrane-associated phospholipid phosphatase